jgi:hypothetical protein
MSRILNYFHDPRFINFVQFCSYTLTAFCGVLAATGSIPTVVTGQIGPVLSVVVGLFLIGSGAVGALGVFGGHWWLERIGIRVSWIGLSILIIPTLYYAILSARSATIWLILALEVMALGDTIKRYRHIDWAYLDPSK